MDVDGYRELSLPGLSLHVLLFISLCRLTVHSWSCSGRSTRGGGGGEGRGRGDHMELTLLWEGRTHHILLEHTTLRRKCNLYRTSNYSDVYTYNKKANYEKSYLWINYYQPMNKVTKILKLSTIFLLLPESVFPSYELPLPRGWIWVMFADRLGFPPLRAAGLGCCSGTCRAGFSLCSGWWPVYAHSEEALPCKEQCHFLLYTYNIVIYTM